MNPNNDLHINNFTNLMFSSLSLPLITLPTHLNVSTLLPFTLIDHIWTNLPFNSQSAVISYRFNYHLPICSFIPDLSTNPLIKIKLRDLSDNDKNNLVNNINNIIPDYNINEGLDESEKFCYMA